VVELFIKTNDLYLIVGSTNGSLTLYRFRKSFEIVQELMVFDQLENSGAITNLKILEKGPKELMIVVGQGGNFER
jgi:hypothetical protein